MNYLKLYKRTHIKKLLAFALLAVLCFITGVKVFHEHAPVHSAAIVNTSTEKFPLQQPGENIYEQCDICDFDFVKNADITVAFPTLLMPYFINTPAVLIPEFPTAGAIISSLLRGPPSFI